MDNAMIMLISGSAINVVMLTALLYLIKKNTNLPDEQAKVYELIIGITIIVIAAEVASCLCDVSGPIYRIPNIITNTIQYCCSISVPYLLAVIFHRRLYEKRKLILIPVVFNAFFVVLSAWTGWIFYISIDNVYSRGPLFFLYVMNYFIGYIIFIAADYRQLCIMQEAERNFMRIMYGTVAIGTTAQVIYPDIHTTWHCITLVLIIYYLFQSEMQLRYDTVTNLLNRQIYKKHLEGMKEEENVAIVLFDVDKFKIVNDTYGHTKGDYCLAVIAGVIKSSFAEIGECYRIGGDEFCVLGKDTDEASVRTCINKMQKQLRKVRKKEAMIPIVSYGFSVYHYSENKDIMDTFKEADEHMYACKRNNSQIMDLMD